MHGGEVRVIKRLRVFDRWGNLVFEKLDVPADESAYWDGYYNNEAVHPGVFLYDLEWELADGSIGQRMGSLTVLL